MNYSNSQRAGVILYLAASLFGGYVYLRKMAIDGMIVNTDTTYLKAMYQEMHKIGVNINQLAKVANTVGTATPQDIEELKEMVKKIWLTLRSFQSNLQ